MTSCESRRSSAYSEDLRWRVVWQREGLGYSCKEIAQNLNIDTSTVYRTLRLFHNSGSVCKKVYPKDRSSRKLTSPIQLLILYVVTSRPGICLEEIKDEIEKVLFVNISVSTICNYLHENGFTRQRLCTVALQRDAFLRHQFTSDMSVYSSDMLIFIDETGADRRNAIRKYGYSMRGRPMKNQALFTRGQRVSAIACISLAGLLDVKTVRGTTDGDIFYSFVELHLLPHLMPFNGINPHSVVILDNCSIHHTPFITRMIEDAGSLVHFLPPYSPDFNPIEEAFSKVKTNLRTVASDMGDIDDVECLLLGSFATITPKDCEGWISHSGIYQ